MRRPDADRPQWIDGRRVQPGDARIDVTDPAIQLGLGLFETLALRGGSCLDLQAHLDRLAGGAERLGIALPSRGALESTLAQAAAEKAEPGWVKLILSASGTWIVFAGSSDPHEEGRPISALTLPWRLGPPGPLSGLKTLNHGVHARGLNHARSRGADEGFWLNHRGRLVEGCWSNVFVWRHGRLFTPSVREGLLPGIVRGRVIDAARERGIVVHDGPLRLKRLLHADEVFVSSSLRGLCTVERLDGRPLGRSAAEAVRPRLAAAIGRG